MMGKKFAYILHDSKWKLVFYVNEMYKFKIRVSFTAMPLLCEQMC